MKGVVRQITNILSLGRNLWLFEMSHAGIWEIILVEMQFNLVMVAVGNEIRYNNCWFR
jgi:hypothetical protein